jgi:hypothetical protein
LASAHSVQRSKDLQEVAKLIRVQLLPEQAPTPPIPTLFPPPPDHPVFVSSPKPLPPPLPPPPPIATVSVPPSPSREEFDQLSKQLMEVGLNTKGILELLAERLHDKVPVLPSSNPVMADPMFIPDRIVPETSSSTMRVKETEVEKDDFDQSQEVLKRIRGSR